MQITPTKISGSFVVTPQAFPDERGTFLELFKAPNLAAQTGRDFTLAQMNCSVSARGVVRGIHFADVSLGQNKYVTCVAGSILDVVVDIRVGSPTFGQWNSVVLDTGDRRAVYVAEGLGHAFLALEDDSTIMYLCGAAFEPSREHEINPLDPRIGIQWPTDVDLIVSEKDRLAPTLAEALAAGTLPAFASS